MAFSVLTKWNGAYFSAVCTSMLLIVLGIHWGMCNSVCLQLQLLEVEPCQSVIMVATHLLCYVSLAC